MFAIPKRILIVSAEPKPCWAVDLKEAFVEHGVVVGHVDVGTDSIQDFEGERVRKLISFYLEHGPDAIIFVNGWGVDAQGVTPELLSKMGIATAFYYFDPAEGWYGNYSQRIPDHSLVVQVEATWMPELKSRPNIKLITHGTAVNQNRFVYLESEPQYDLGFVGHLKRDFSESMRRHLQLHLDENSMLVLEQAVIETKNWGGTFEDYVLQAMKKLGHSLELTSHKFFQIAYLYVMNRSVYEHRQETLESLLSFNPRIFGPGGWDTEFPDYYCGRFVEREKMGDFYRQHKINLVLASAQSSTMMDYRTLETFLSGAFPIAEYVEEYEEHFVLGKDLICFRSQDELKNSVRFYLDNPSQRKALIERGRDAVMRSCLCRHRVGEILHELGVTRMILKEKFATASSLQIIS